MSENVFYDGTKLLSMKDINGNTPEVFLCTSNRNAGKTTYFNRLMVNRWLKKQEKFCLVYRFSYELDNVDEKFFKDIGGLFFRDCTFESSKEMRGMYTSLWLNGENCGYAIALNTADNIKKISHVFSDVKNMEFDEFQSETNHYCSDEANKFISVHTSIARGQGEQVRYVPVYMVSNNVTLLNPYYIMMGIASRINSNTKFLRGDGFVLENGFNESASKQQMESGFNKAFSKSKYVAYAAQNIYLNDNMAFIERPRGANRYICTIRYKGTEFGIREFTNDGIMYVDKSPDVTSKYRFVATTEDHNVDYVMLMRNSFFFTQLRTLFEQGSFRFYDIECKDMLMNVLSYSLQLRGTA